MSRVPAVAVLVLLAVLLAGCGPVVVTERPPGPRPAGAPADAGEVTSVPEPSATEREVEPLDRRVRPELLVRGGEAIPAEVYRRLRDTPGVSRTTAVGVGPVPVRAGREASVTVAAVDPSAYRAFAPEGTAESDQVWERVAGGEAAMSHAAADRLEVPLGETVALAGARVRVGAFATTVPGVDVVVDRTTGDRLGVPSDNGVVVATASGPETATVSEVASRLRRILGEHHRVERLGTEPAGASRLAFLTGGEAARAFGTFRYRWRADGSLWIDPAFVDANIRTERVPVLGEVRCHRLMFPQLRGALREVAERGLGAAIHPHQYGGCFVPKGIEGSPGAISLHTWGIAIDLNVPGNLRGTEGEIDRRVVAIFKKWGFAWGGDWNWTDPMHFELAGVLTTSDD